MRTSISACGKKLLMLGALMPMMAFGYETETIDGVQWHYSGGSICGVTPCEGGLVIPGTIHGVQMTEIASKAFYGATNLVSVSIPEGVVSIGAEAFRGCINLREVEFPDSLTTIEDRAFQGCESLEEVILPKELTTICRFAFLNCVSLRSLILNNKLNAIGINAFYGCVNIGQVILPNSLEKLGQSSFGNCISAEIVVGRGLKEIDALSWANFGCDRLSKSIYFNCRPPTGWDRFWSVIGEKPVIAWSHEFDEEWRTVLGLGNKTLVHVLSSELRKNDPTILDVRYIVLSPHEKVSVRALAFEDGERSFWKVVRAMTFTKDLDGNETACNIGDGIAANVPHKLAWKVSADWKTDLAKVKFEVICSDAAQLPLKLQTIPATAKNPAMTVGYNSQSDADIFNALLWYYADGVDDITNIDGYVDLNHPYANQVDTTNIRIVNRTSIANRPEALRYIYKKMGYEPLEGGNLMDYVRKATRKDLWFNSGTQNCSIKSSTKPANLYLGEKAFCVIDVSGGPSAVSYPVSYIDSEPMNGWGDEYKTTKILLRWCEAGKYNMQNNKAVTLTKPFYMGVFTVTQKQYTQVMGTNPTPSGHVGNLRPVEISWNAIRGNSATYKWPTVRTVDPNTFVGKIQAKTGLSFDLPTEAQWEYACRAGTSSNYGNGGGSDNDLRLMGHAWSDNAVNVGLYIPNFWGFYDMHGNVGQWCLDYSDGYNSDPAIDYEGAESGSARVIRGCIYSYSDYYCCATSFYRYGGAPSSSRYDDYGHTFLGFRLSMTLSE